MNKLELIEHVASSASISKADATRAVDALIGGIVDTVKGKGKVTIVGFGTFKHSDRKGRTGRDPRTGAPITIAPTTVPKFTADKEFKDAVKAG